jgi:hypothetical protein
MRSRERSDRIALARKQRKARLAPSIIRDEHGRFVPVMATCRAMALRAPDQSA